MNIRVGLIGRQISHSRSLQIFQAIAEITGNPIDFVRHDIVAGDLKERVQQLRDDRYLGCSVTNPYKESVIRFLDCLDSSAARLHAVNSIAVHQGKLTGYNTDQAGFDCLLEQANLRNKQRGLIFGAGGAARAVVAALLARETEITVACRQVDQFDVLREIFATRSHLLSYVNSSAKMTAEGFQFVVNTTPLGGANQAETPCIFNFGHATGCYFDLNYNQPNSWIDSARAAGWSVQDGSCMLVAQATRSLEIWTGIKVDINLLHQKVFGS